MQEEEIASIDSFVKLTTTTGKKMTNKLKMSCQVLISLREVVVVDDDEFAWVVVDCLSSSSSKRQNST